MATAVILLAGGAGSRLQASENKVYLPVGGKPLISWSLEAFDASPLIDEIVLVIRSEDDAQAREALRTHPAGKVTAIIEGGSTRHASEHAGLEQLATRIDAGLIDLVLIHDGARPFVREDLLTRVVGTAREVGGALPGLPVETPLLLRVDATTAEGNGQTAVPTDDLRRVQTPQAFWARELISAFRVAAREGFTGVDTAESVQRFSDLEVAVVEADPDNIKVTFVEDLFTAERLAESWPDRG